MERRSETRFEPDQPVSVVLLNGADAEIPARIVNMSGKGISLAAEQQLPIGSAVKVNLEDSMLLGEVCHCHHNQGSWIFGVKLDQVITSVSELSRLVTTVMGYGREREARLRTAAE
jgi:hypothetical protein